MASDTVSGPFTPAGSMGATDAVDSRDADGAGDPDARLGRAVWELLAALGIPRELAERWTSGGAGRRHTSIEAGPDKDVSDDDHPSEARPTSSALTFSLPADTALVDALLDGVRLDGAVQDSAAPTLVEVFAADGLDAAEVLADAGDAFFVLDTDGVVLAANRAAARLLRTDADALTGARLQDIFTTDSALQLSGLLARLAASETSTAGAAGETSATGGEHPLTGPRTPPEPRVTSARLDAAAIRIGGSIVSLELTIWLRTGLRGCRVFMAARDVTRRRRREAELAQRARHDPLTGLANRSVAIGAIDRVIRSSRTSTRFAALLFIDVDRLKSVNDRYGHLAGDRLLQVIAERLTDAVRPTDLVARLSGDEFAVLCTDLPTRDEAMLVAGRVHAALANRISVDADRIAISASIGIAFAEPGIGTAEDLLSAADAAMYRAKTRGGGRTEIYDASHESRRPLGGGVIGGGSGGGGGSGRSRSGGGGSGGGGSDAAGGTAGRAAAAEWARAAGPGCAADAADLAAAIDRDELLLHYQPIVDLAADNRVVGAEALLRWQHPSRGLLLPEEFVPLAERTGLIVPIGEWVLERAAGQARLWRAGGNAELKVTVNLSSRQLGGDGFADTAAGILARTGVAGAAIRLDIRLEPGICAARGEWAANLSRLRELGVGLAVDDFAATGSPLNSLTELPVDTVKIDRTFIAGVESSPGQRSLVRAVVELAHDLRLAVHAEGVESAGEFLQLRSLGCDLAQGYYFAAPAPIG